MGVVINGKVAYEASPMNPLAFYHAGDWYMWESDLEAWERMNEAREYDDWRNNQPD